MKKTPENMFILFIYHVHVYTSFGDENQRKKTKFTANAAFISYSMQIK